MAFRRLILPGATHVAAAAMDAVVGIILQARRVSLHSRPLWVQRSFPLTSPP